MAKQVLVTGGASGLVSSHLAEALETRGHSALAMTHILIRTPALESRSSATFTNLPV
jgi:nucleoside-diphosphate-sugar epimerase